MCIFYVEVVALQYGRRAHFRAQGLGRPVPLGQMSLFWVSLGQSFCKKPCRQNCHGPHCLKGHCPDYAHARASSVFLKNTTELSF